MYVSFYSVITLNILYINTETPEITCHWERILSFDAGQFSQRIIVTMSKGSNPCYGSRMMMLMIYVGKYQIEMMMRWWWWHHCAVMRRWRTLMKILRWLLTLGQEDQPTSNYLVRSFFFSPCHFTIASAMFNNHCAPKVFTRHLL